MAAAALDFSQILQASGKYGDEHRALLNMLIDRGSMSERAFTAHFVRCFAAEHKPAEIDEGLNQLPLTNVTPEAVARLRKKLLEVFNEKTQHIGLRLMNARDEITDRKMIVLITERHYTPGIAAASPFDTNELFLIVSWLEEMLKADNDGYISVGEALESARSLPVPMKMEKAQLLIDHLTKDEWIRREAGDQLTLTTRALTELGPILRSRYHAATCCLCGNVTVRKASMLSCSECECLIHVSCWSNLAKNATKDEVRCPGGGCKNTLKKDDMVECMRQIVEARSNEGRTSTQRRHVPSAGPSRKSSARGRKTQKAASDSEGEEEAAVMAAEEREEEEDAMEEEDDVFEKEKKKKKGSKASQAAVKEENEEEEEKEEQQSQRPTRQRRKSRKAIVSDEEAEEEEAAPSTQKKARKHPRRSEGLSEQKPRKKSKEEEEEDDDAMEM